MNRMSHKGFGLIELMVSIVIGLIVVGGVTALVVSVLRANNENMAMTRLTQELRGAAELVTRDVRRAGFTATAAKNIGRLSQNTSLSVVNDFDEVIFYDGSTEVDFTATPYEGPADCVLFSYDANGDGTLSSGDYRGFRFASDRQAIEMYVGDDTNWDCGTTTNWEALTDPNTLEVTEFSFSTKDQQPFKHPTVGNLEVTVREIVITLDGRLRGDPEVSRTVAETIRVRNDLVVNNP